MSDLIRRLYKAVKNAADTESAYAHIAELLGTQQNATVYDVAATEHENFRRWLLGQPAVCNAGFSENCLTGVITYLISEDQSAWEAWQERGRLNGPVTDTAIAYLAPNNGVVYRIVPGDVIPDNAVLLAPTTSHVGDAEQLLEDKALLLSIANELHTLIEHWNSDEEDDGEKWDFESCQNIQEIVDRM